MQVLTVVVVEVSTTVLKTTSELLITDEYS